MPRTLTYAWTLPSNELTCCNHPYGRLLPGEMRAYPAMAADLPALLSISLYRSQLAPRPRPKPK